jgi:hypothetical protein
MTLSIGRSRLLGGNFAAKPPICLTSFEKEYRSMDAIFLIRSSYCPRHSGFAGNQPSSQPKYASAIQSSHYLTYWRKYTEFYDRETPISSIGDLE